VASDDFVEHLLALPKVGAGQKSSMRETRALAQARVHCVAAKLVANGLASSHLAAKPPTSA
jgi:hypothetical protein